MVEPLPTPHLDLSGDGEHHIALEDEECVVAKEADEQQGAGRKALEREHAERGQRDGDGEVIVERGEGAERELAPGGDGAWQARRSNAQRPSQHLHYSHFSKGNVRQGQRTLEGKARQRALLQ